MQRLLPQQRNLRSLDYSLRRITRLLR